MTEAYPLQWPAGWARTPDDKQQRGHQFKQTHYVQPGDNSTGVARRSLVGFAAARDKLVDELRRLGARNFVISSNHPVDRRTSFPVESKRSVKDEGVAIYFRLEGDRPLAMACDRFDNAAANMRSLGLAIEAMRQLERHGGGVMMQRAFQGFEALPAPKSCWEVLGLEASASEAEVERAYRAIAKTQHPDHGGSSAAMAELNAARGEAHRQLTLKSIGATA